MTTIEETSVLHRYYDILRGGAEAYGDGGSLLDILAGDFVFDGPIAGRMEGGDRFIHGVRGFIETVREITILQSVTTLTGAAVLYDAELPGGVIRFAEFFTLEDDRIRELTLLYNAEQYVARGGR
ncbi:MAG: nuclear transport factor 2 family protein [Mycetocola sp.]